jgi:hypothetical protein
MLDIKYCACGCDGGYWHSTAKAKIIDQEKDEIAKDNGYALN